jgi:hypothetical protein
MPRKKNTVHNPPTTAMAVRDGMGADTARR